MISRLSIIIYIYIIIYISKFRKEKRYILDLNIEKVAAFEEFEDEEIRALGFDGSEQEQRSKADQEE